jgi:prefoldin subunit 5
MSSPNSINLNEIPPIENLLATRSQVEKDLQLLMDSMSQLKGAQINFSTSIQSLESLKTSSTN